VTLRCGCANEGDATVFGENHECGVNPKPPADLPRFVSSWAFVVPAERPYETTLGEDETHE
jgi:hypothetical protein